MSTHNKEAAEPMDEWIDYAKRSGLLDEHGVAPDPSKAQTAWFAFTYAWNRRSALAASEAPAITEQAPLDTLVNRVANTAFACGAFDSAANQQAYLELMTKAGKAREELRAALRAESAPAIIDYLMTEQASEAVKTWPDRIYLQHSEDQEAPNFQEVFSQRDEITWCQDRQFDGDVEYVRADLARRPEQAPTIKESLTTEQAPGEYISKCPRCLGSGHVSEQAPAGEVPNSWREAAEGAIRYTEACDMPLTAKAHIKGLAKLLLSTPPAAPHWKPITAPGQAKVGDKLRFDLCGETKTHHTVRQVLNGGTDREEIIYNRRKNWYIITSMAIAGAGSQKNVRLLSAAPAVPTKKPEQFGAAPDCDAALIESYLVQGKAPPAGAYHLKRAILIAAAPQPQKEQP